VSRTKGPFLCVVEVPRRDELADLEVLPVLDEQLDHSADDEGWDDPEEKTKLFSKDEAPSGVLVAIRPPAAAKGARVARHALRPPPPQLADEDDDDAKERPSILPDERSKGGTS
jgi:hypothetical protein